MAFFLGIDGGGTKTECVIGDEYRVLGRSLGNTIKIKKVGKDAAAEALNSAIQEACKQAGVGSRQFSRICIGIAGSSIPEVTEWTYGSLKQFACGDVIVMNDAQIAHHAAFHGGPGVLVIAGTGSNVLGINERGEYGRAGGWGPIISDEGSGFWIGRTAVANAMRAHDSLRSTDLLTAIMRAWGLNSLQEVVSMANSNPPPDFASLVPQVLRSADEGDSLAREILTSAANELAQLARIVIRKLWPAGGQTSVAVTGGIFSHSAQIREIFAHTIRGEGPGVTLSLEPVHPVMGALEIARNTGITP